MFSSIKNMFTELLLNKQMDDAKNYWKERLPNKLVPICRLKVIILCFVLSVWFMNHKLLTQIVAWQTNILKKGNKANRALAIWSSCFWCLYILRFGDCFMDNCQKYIRWCWQYGLLVMQMVCFVCFISIYNFFIVSFC